ncbi:hypothetical protein D3C80_1339980 [compost metagenome]
MGGASNLHVRRQAGVEQDHLGAAIEHAGTRDIQLLDGRDVAAKPGQIAEGHTAPLFEALPNACNFGSAGQLRMCLQLRQYRATRLLLERLFKRDRLRFQARQDVAQQLYEAAQLAELELFEHAGDRLATLPAHVLRQIDTFHRRIEQTDEVHLVGQGLELAGIHACSKQGCRDGPGGGAGKSADPLQFALCLQRLNGTRIGRPLGAAATEHQAGERRSLQGDGRRTILLTGDGHLAGTTTFADHVVLRRCGQGGVAHRLQLWTCYASQRSRKAGGDLLPLTRGWFNHT